MIALEDQEKTIFNFPYSTFAYRQMPFGLSNAPTTFEWCIIDIFDYLVEDIMEIFIDDSSFRDLFYLCLQNLTRFLKRCEETNLALKWVKCHCIFQEGIALGHKISCRGIEVGKAEIETIEKLPPPSSVIAFWSFLGILVSTAGL